MSRRPGIQAKVTRHHTRHDWADTLAAQCRAVCLPEPVRELQAIAGRKFRLDLAWPLLTPPVCAEVDGAEWTQGRHGRGAGMASDAEKQNLLVLAGWRPLRFVGSQVRSGAALAVLEQVLRCG